MSDNPKPAGPAIRIRDAVPADLADLQALEGTKTVHADRIREAELGWMHYLVGEVQGRVIGSGLIYYSAMADLDRPEHVPLLVALYVRPDWRGWGVGTALVREMTTRAARQGFSAIYLRVESRNNPRAFALYGRLGFEPLQTEPFRDPYRFTDSEGNVHEGVEWNVEMVRYLGDGESRIRAAVSIGRDPCAVACVLSPHVGGDYRSSMDRTSGSRATASKSGTA